MKTSRIIPHGIHMLLKGDGGKNIERMEYFDKNWLVKDKESEAQPFNVYFKLMPSEEQVGEIEDFIKKQQIDLTEFFKGAFKVGVVSLRNEDPLGRGKY
jgi:hypothetical protein